MSFLNPDIKSAIESDKLVFFIGAGFSTGFGYPDWQGLIKKVLNRLGEYDSAYQSFIPLLERGLMKEIDVLESIKSDKSILLGEIESLFQFDESKRHLLVGHEQLLKVSRKVITTNYDDLLERASAFSIKKVVYTSQFRLSTLSDLPEYIFKIHGDYEDSAKCILFKDQYEDLYKKDNAALNEFKRIITDCCVVFIGFSLADPYVSYLFKYMGELYSDLKRPHYILTTNERDFSAYGTKSIKLDSWGDIPAFLRELGDYKESLQQSFQSSELEVIDEDEFKKFIIDFHDHAEKHSTEKVLKQVGLDEKFEGMRCNVTFKKQFERLAMYFPSVDSIMHSATFVGFDRKDLIADYIISIYNQVYYKLETGEAIFERIVDEVYSEYRLSLSYSTLKQYIRVLVAWYIYECDIFNENLSEILQVLKG